MRIVFSLMVTLIVTLGASFTVGAYPGELDSTFKSSEASRANLFCEQSDGRMVVATSLDGVEPRGIVRFNLDGSRDNTFAQGFVGLDSPGRVDACWIDDQDRIYVMGFSRGRVSYQSTPIDLIRLTADGEYDASFDLGTRFNTTPTSTAGQSCWPTFVKSAPNNKLIIGFSLKCYDGVDPTPSRIYMLDLNNNNSVVARGPSLGDDYYGTVSFYSVGSSGYIYYSSESRPYSNELGYYRYGRLASDLSIDNAYNGGEFSNLETLDSYYYPSYESINESGQRIISIIDQNRNAGEVRYHTYNINPDGTINTDVFTNSYQLFTFNPRNDPVVDPPPFNEDVTIPVDYTLQNDGKLVVWERPANSGKARLVRYMPDGSLDPSFQYDYPSSGYPLGSGSFIARGILDIDRRGEFLYMKSADDIPYAAWSGYNQLGTLPLYRLHLTPSASMSRSTVVMDDESAVSELEMSIDTKPTTDAVFTVTSSDASKVSVETQEITFTQQNWDQPQTVRVRALQNEITGSNPLQTITITPKDGTNIAFRNLEAQQVSVSVADDDIDSDGDGILGPKEDNIHGGDGNADGVPDKKQSAVVSFKNELIDGDTTIAFGEDAAGSQDGSARCTAKPGVDVLSIERAGAISTDFSYPLGLYSFSVTCSGSSKVPITIHLDKLYDTSTWKYRKYNSKTKQYSDMTSYVTYGTATINNKQVTTISYTLTDGGPLDEDGTVNGTIVDPAGPAIATATSAPVEEVSSESTVAPVKDALANTGYNIIALAGVSAAVVVAGVVLYRRNK